MKNVSKFKKPLLFISTLLAFVFLSSCESDTERINNMDWNVTIVDSCEYVIAKAPSGDYGWVMSHKGNCKFCRSRSK